MPLPQGAAVPAGLQAILLPHHKYAGADLRRSYGEAIAILLDRYNGAKGKEGKQSAVKASVHSTHTLDGTVKPGQYETSRTALLILDGKALAASVFVSLGDIGEGGILVSQNAVLPTECVYMQACGTVTLLLQVTEARHSLGIRGTDCLMQRAVTHTA